MPLHFDTRLFLMQKGSCLQFIFTCKLCPANCLSVPSHPALKKLLAEKSDHSEGASLLRVHTAVTSSESQAVGNVWLCTMPI